MTTWNEWYGYLDKLLIPKESCQPSKLLKFFQEARRCRSELPFSRNDPRARILDELWSAGVRLVYVDLVAAENHRRTAAMLHSKRRGSVQFHRADLRSAA